MSEGDIGCLLEWTLWASIRLARGWKKESTLYLISNLDKIPPPIFHGPCPNLFFRLKQCQGQHIFLISSNDPACSNRLIKCIFKSIYRQKLESQHKYAKRNQNSHFENEFFVIQSSNSATNPVFALQKGHSNLLYSLTASTSSCSTHARHAVCPQAVKAARLGGASAKQIRHELCEGGAAGLRVNGFAQKKRFS